MKAQLCKKESFKILFYDQQPQVGQRGESIERAWSMKLRPALLITFAFVSKHEVEMNSILE